MPRTHSSESVGGGRPVPTTLCAQSCCMTPPLATGVAADDDDATGLRSRTTALWRSDKQPESRGRGRCSAQRRAARRQRDDGDADAQSR